MYLNGNVGGLKQLGENESPLEAKKLNEYLGQDQARYYLHRKCDDLAGAAQVLVLIEDGLDGGDTIYSREET